MRIRRSPGSSGQNDPKSRIYEVKFKFTLLTLVACLVGFGVWLLSRDPVVKITIIVEPGFSGTLKVMDSPGQNWNPRHDFTYRQVGGALVADDGGIGSQEWYEVRLVVDKVGRKLPPWTREGAYGGFTWTDKGTFFKVPAWPKR